MKLYASLEYLLNISENRNPTYFVNFHIRKNANYSNKIISNFFSVEYNTFKLFAKYLSNLPDENPRKINLKIDDNPAFKTLKTAFLQKEHIAPKERELEIRNLFIKKIDYSVFDANFRSQNWTTLYNLQLEIPNIS